jgi:hypothetical protein
MKKLSLLIIGIFLFANSQKDVYLDYTNKIINYNFKIENLNKIKPPFYNPVLQKNVYKNEKLPKKAVKKVVKIDLLSILDKKAYIKLSEFIGGKLVKVNKKWVKRGDVVYGCKLIKLTDSDAVFKCKNKKLYKSLNQKIPLLRNSK